jgi:hypothetical protein
VNVIHLTVELSFVSLFYSGRTIREYSMKILGTCLAVLLLASAAAIDPSNAQTGWSERDDDVDWTTYSVPQFGTRVAYPASLFSISEGEPEFGIGQRFRTSDGRAVLSVYSRANAGGETPRSYLRNNLRRPRSNLDYERVARSFFAISEETEDKIYYSRCNFSNAAIHCFDLVYPTAEKRAWNAIVTRISRSLRPLQG